MVTVKLSFLEIFVESNFLSFSARRLTQSATDRSFPSAIEYRCLLAPTVTHFVATKGDVTAFMVPV